MGSASLERFVKARRGVTLLGPPSSCQCRACTVRSEICDAHHMDPSQIQCLGKEHRGELASADDADFDRAGRLGALCEKSVQTHTVLLSARPLDPMGSDPTG